MTELSNESYKRIATVFLVLTAIFFTATVVLSVYHFVNTRRLAQREAALLSKEEIQRKLSEGGLNEYVIYPHSVREIGYTLNHNLRESSWQAAPGHVYKINRLGLRGDQWLSKKPWITHRILLVGDSYLFGWKLKNSERLNAIMGKICKNRLKQRNVQFLPIALPGWNVRNQKAFLEYYWHILKADAIIWSVVANDSSDSNGCVPPGILLKWVSSHKTEDLHFYTSHYSQEALPIPIITNRWKENLRLIRSFSKSTGTPVILLYWYPRMKIKLEELREQFGDQTLSAVYISPAITSDKRFAVESWDAHPSAWANRQISIGLLDKLIQMKILPHMDFTPPEKRILQLFEAAWKAKPEKDFYKRFCDEIPTEYSISDDNTQLSALCGIENKKMMQTGVLCVRDVNNSKGIKLTIDVFEHHQKERNIHVEIKDLKGETTQKTMLLGTGKSELILPLPGEGKYDLPSLYQVSWKYNFANCSDPIFCFSGKLLAVQFLR